MQHLRRQDQVAGVCQLTNAASVVAMVLGRVNAHPEEEREADEEDNVDAVDEEDAMLDEEAVSRHLVL